MGRDSHLAREEVDLFGFRFEVVLVEDCENEAQNHQASVVRFGRLSPSVADVVAMVVSPHPDSRRW